MTTEPCSVDSLSKSRTETFARQLQNRLRTLNGDEVDGLEDTSWKRDQASSSSEDIYYDLDSYPGSPGEEATEVDFTNFINKKNIDGIYTSTSNGFLHQNNKSIQYENKLDCEHVEQCSGVDSNNICNKCPNKPDHEFQYEYCTDNNTHEDCFYLPNKRIHHVCNCNCSHETNHTSTTNQLNCTDIESDTDDHNFFLASQMNNCESNMNECNGTSNRLQCNGDCNVTQHTDQDIYDTELDDCSCSCNHNKFMGLNHDSTLHVQNFNNNPSNVTIRVSVEREMSPRFEKGLFNCNDDFMDLLNGSEEEEGVKDDSYMLCNNEEVPCKVDYSEEDLSRLVDAVFLKSEENGFDGVCCNDVTSLEKSTLKVENQIGVNDMESIESKRAKFRRCSSLKSGKTPPGTPGCKKIVRFADVLGLDLADVRTFLDEVPRVPKSAFNDLNNVELSSSPPVTMLHSFMNQAPTPVKVQKTIVPLFQQPSSLSEFIDRIRSKFVCLENAVVSDSALSVITGVVRVKNIDFNKSVHVRYSFDCWKSFADLQANYVSNSCDGFSDKFTFSLYAHMLNVGQRLEFAVRYHAGGSVFWDNNYGANYAFQCVPDGQSKVLPTTSTYVPPSHVEAWASFY